ncbi:MAG TPA: hypothetical protein VMG35_06300, partial [Bryobacteraceae bacterium]|nr:hypothetical protein [Bryobacteraceae bacterium]
MTAERREVQESRYTSLDRMINRANASRQVNGSDDAGYLIVRRNLNGNARGEFAKIREQHIAARLAALQKMGLAEQATSGEWRVRRAPRPSMLIATPPEQLGAGSTVWPGKSGVWLRLPVLLQNQCTENATLLDSVPLGVVTCTIPEVAPDGTTAVINAPDCRTWNVAGVPLNVTLVAPVSFVPRMSMVLPTFPAPGSVFTNGGNPVES